MSDTAPVVPRFACKARWIFPVSAAPLADGYLTMAGEKIVGVSDHAPECPIFDVGNVAIVPGFVNAHTHLEFSDLTQPIGQPGVALPDWIAQVVAHRRTTGHDPNAIVRGLGESLASGTTALGDIATVDDRADDSVLAALKTDVVVFFELIAPTVGRVDAAVEAAQKFLLESCPDGLTRPGLSPHAPYTVHRDLLEQLVALSCQFNVPLAMHLAESREELELLHNRSGAFRDLLTRLQAWDTQANSRFERVLDYLERLSLAPRALVVHGNYLDSFELEFLAAHASTMSVVYCPRTHHFFRHADYPLAKMLAMNVSVALGTDSRASNPDLSLFEEMRFVAQRHPDVSLAKVLELGTLDGARALGLDGSVGSLESGKLANFALIDLADNASANDASREPHEMLFAPAARVTATWVRGQSMNQANRPH